MRVHLDLAPELIPDDYVLIEIETGLAPIGEGDPETQEPRALGDAWLSASERALLKVPSFMAPHSANVLINLRHCDAAAMAIVGTQPFDFVRRLWLPLTR